MSTVTPEIRTALAAMSLMGVEFYSTRAKEFACGCVVMAGWVVETQEPGIRIRACSAEHELAASRAGARWADPDVVERFSDVAGYLAAAELLEEEIER
jgi:hypothetical protein